ncbi:hypothetical protein DTO271G3_5999 [Paecilomyces variotii]|nr:hypothetical protein DTO271G3_5999 [Paecilomyces variotii]
MPQKFREYAYDPSAGAAIVAIVCFCLTSALHTWQLVRTRSRSFIPLTIGGYLEIIGYACRLVASHQSPNFTRSPFIVETVLILVAPAFFSASIYMLLGRIIRIVDGESRSIISRRWLTKIFVFGDVVSLFLQAIGGVLITQKDADKIDHGKKIVDAGLFTQIASFGFFVVTATAFHIRLKLNPTAASLTKNNPWRKDLYTLYITSILILVRCIVRVVEYLQGVSGYIMTHEVFIYVFDFLLMFIVMVIFNIIHPSGIYAVLRGGGKVSKYCRTKQYDIAMLERRELETVETGQAWESNALR